MLLLVAFLIAALWLFGAVTALAICRVAARADALNRTAARVSVLAAGPRPPALLAE